MMGRLQIRNDLVAGLSGAVAGTPQAMGFALIAGINPVFGLYTASVTTIVAALFGHSSLMTVGPTNALSLVVAGVLANNTSETAQVDYLVLLTFLVGVWYLAFGLLRLGTLVRFVSNAVMTGFVSGAALLIVFGQLRYLNGYRPSGESVLLRVTDWLGHLHQGSLPMALISLVVALAILILRRTRLSNFATLIGIGVGTLLTLGVGWEAEVELIGDLSAIPEGLPAFRFPDLSLAGELLPAALAIAVLGAVQSAAIIGSFAERNNEHADINRDFVGIGLGNCAGSLFQAMPACGSLSRTAVNVLAGAKTRWANIFAGGFVLLFLFLLGDVITLVPLSALAVQLIIAAVSLIDVKEIRTVWHVAPAARLAMSVTFLSTLILPLEYSIYAGVGVSLVLYVYSSSEELGLVQLIPVGGGRFRIAPVPNQLPENSVIVLSVSGHVYFAAVARLERLLPDPEQTRNCIVILRLRDNAFLASTGIRFLERYARALQRRGGRLLLSGLSPRMVYQLSRVTTVFREDDLYAAHEIMLEGTARAYHHALSTQESEAQPA